MFKWTTRWRSPRTTDDGDRESGEDRYESEQEERREVSPSGETRVKTDHI